MSVLACLADLILNIGYEVVFRENKEAIRVSVGLLKKTRSVDYRRIYKLPANSCLKQ